MCIRDRIADEDLSKVETISFSPVYTTGEKMAKAGMNTLMAVSYTHLDVYKRQL